MRGGNEDVEAGGDVGGVVCVGVRVGCVDEAFYEEDVLVVEDAGGEGDGIREGGEDDFGVVGAEAAEGGVHVWVWGSGDSGPSC